MSDAERFAGGRLDRRRFLGAALPLGIALPALLRGSDDPRGAALPQRAGSARLEGWGVQLYTLRGALAEDLERTLAAVAEIGYEEVELAGLYGDTPRAFRAKLDAVGLRATSSHHGVGELGEAWRAVLDGARTLGQRLVVVPSIPADQRDPASLRRLADRFDRAGEAARSVGLRFGYHNHDWEMRPGPDGVRPIDLLMDRTDPDLVAWQMDVFWTVHGGADPMAELDRRRGRVTSVHVKDRSAAGEMVDVGDGVIDFDAVLSRASALGLRHAYVEHDRPADPLRSIRRSFDALRPLLLSGARPDPRRG